MCGLSIIIFQLGPVTMSVWRLQYEIDEGAHVPYARSLCILHHGRVEHLIPPPPRGRPRGLAAARKQQEGFLRGDAEGSRWSGAGLLSIGIDEKRLLFY